MLDIYVIPSIIISVIRKKKQKRGKQKWKRESILKATFWI